jgi:hypothetical protein
VLEVVEPTEGSAVLALTCVVSEMATWGPRRHARADPLRATPPQARPLDLPRTLAEVVKGDA